MKKFLVILTILIAVPVVAVFWFRSQVADFKIASTQTNTQADTILGMSSSFVDNYVTKILSEDDTIPELRSRGRNLRATHARVREGLSLQEKVQLIHGIQSGIFALIASVPPEHPLFLSSAFVQLKEEMNWKGELREKMQEYNQSVLTWNNLIRSKSFALTANLVGEQEQLPYLNVDGFAPEPDIRM